MTEVRVAATGNASIDEYYRVDRIPGPDEAQEVQESFWRFGGAATNVAVALARLGAYSRFIGLVGKDRYGEMILEELRGKGVDTGYVKRLDLPSGRVIIVLDSEGRRAMLAIRGANKKLAPGSIDPQATLSGVDHLHFSSTKPEYTAWLAGEAKRRGLTVSYDPGMAVAYKGFSYISAALEHVDVLFVNEREYEALGGEKILEVFQGVIVLKVGEKGSLLPREGIEAPGFKVEARDTTGAGDAFDAAFLVCWKTIGLSKKCLEFANAVGALKVTRIGAHESPSLEEVRRFMSERGMQCPL